MVVDFGPFAACVLKVPCMVVDLGPITTCVLKVKFISRTRHFFAIKKTELENVDKVMLTRVWSSDSDCVGCCPESYRHWGGGK